MISVVYIILYLELYQGRVQRSGLMRNMLSPLFTMIQRYYEQCYTYYQEECCVQNWSDAGNWQSIWLYVYHAFPLCNDILIVLYTYIYRVIRVLYTYIQLIALSNVVLRRFTNLCSLMCSLEYYIHYHGERPAQKNACKPL